MKVNIFRRMVKGRGMTRSIKSAISATSSRKTWRGKLLAFVRCGFDCGFSRCGVGCRQVIHSNTSRMRGIDSRGCNRASSCWIAVVLSKIVILSCVLFKERSVFVGQATASAFAIFCHLTKFNIVGAAEEDLQRVKRLQK
jgi:hypothetical protein